MADNNSVPFRPVDLLVPGRREAIAAQRCIASPIGCGCEATFFRDELSEREFRISGLCQRCQDSIFCEDVEDR